MDDQALSIAGVIINPRSGRGRGKGLALAQALSVTEKDAPHLQVLNTFAELEPALQRFASSGVTDLFISSGDGTVQAIQTWLAESKAFKTLPRLCLLPHGTTNMTAADLGFRRNNIAEQVRFIRDPQVNQTRARHTLRIVNPKGSGPLHAMFFGTGAASEATRYCQTAFNDKGVGGNMATFATLATVISKSLFRAPNANDPHRFDKPYNISLHTDAAPVCNGNQLLMLATTLEKLILGAKPFWGGNNAAIRTTVFPYPIPSIPRWIIPALYGSEQRNGPPGAISRACHTCAVTSTTSFVIDGEFHEFPDTGALHIETGPLFEYICT